MKTFEEAVDATLESEGMLLANIQSSRHQLHECEKWKCEIADVATQILSDVVKMAQEKAEAVRIVAVLCASLQIVFEWGKLVGMEMEKP